MDKNEQERNEHFQGFAKLLWSELQTALHDLIREPEDIIAQRAYDLVEHTIEAMKPSIYTNAFTPDNLAEISKIIPDLTEWPITESSQ